jgi:sRNA-binding regulator protein Hfq
MSLGDYLRHARALRGGLELNALAKSLGQANSAALSQIETRYREVGDDELLAKLAAYLDVSVDELHWHRARYRKKLSAFVEDARSTQTPVCLRLRSGATLTGRVQVWDLGCVILVPDDGPEIVVQRHAVVDWAAAAGNENASAAA